NAQAAFLRDSSLTVKKKLRPALIVEAQSLDSLAAIYRDDAQELKSQANTIKSQENALLAALPETNSKNVDQETVKDVVATNEYKDYFEAKTTGDSNLFRAEEIGNDIATLQDKKARTIKQAVVTYGDGQELENALANNSEL